MGGPAGSVLVFRASKALDLASRCGCQPTTSPSSQPCGGPFRPRDPPLPLSLSFSPGRHLHNPNILSSFMQARFQSGVSLSVRSIIASGFFRLSRAISHFLGHFCSRLGCKGPLVFNKFLPSDVCPPSARDISPALGEHSYQWATVWNSVSRLRCGTLPCRQPRCRATRSTTSNRPAHRKHPKLDSFCYHTKFFQKCVYIVNV